MACVFPGLRISTKEEAEYGNIKPLSFIISQTSSFKSEIALLFLREVSVIVFVKSSETSLIVSVCDS